MRVLMVERSPFMRLVLREVLARAHHETVGECTELGEAVALANELAPDVVLFDLEGARDEWPEKMINLRRQAPSIRLVALGPPGMTPGASNGFAAYLNKPCTPEAVLAALHSDNAAVPA